MKAIPKNTTENHTDSWKRERDRQIKFYNEQPFYGSKVAEKMYESVKKIIPSVLQVSHCGPIVSIVTYKQDADKAVNILHKMFNGSPKQNTCPYTDFVTTFVINK